MNLNSKIPQGPLEQKWTYYKDHARLVNPSNKRNIEIIIVGTGLAGASAAASLAEMGYSVKALCFQDSPRDARTVLLRKVE
jgi:succinate dehydrogenase / fumarate reductase flavoprotein subunit